MKKILLIILILLSLVLIAYAAEIFSDDFETGDLTEWTGSEEDGGTIAAHADAALHGSYGAKCTVDATTIIGVYDTTPSAETRYRIRFYVDPNGLSMSTDAYLALFNGYTSGWASVFFILLGYDGSDYYIEAANSAYSTVFNTTITDAPHCVEVDWKAGATDGELYLWVDGALVDSATNVTADFTVDNCELGGMSFDGTIAGVYYIDDIVSNDDGTEIGVISDATATHVFFTLSDF